MLNSWSNLSIFHCHFGWLHGVSSLWATTVWHNLLHFSVWFVQALRCPVKHQPRFVNNNHMSHKWCSLVNLQINQVSFFQFQHNWFSTSYNLQFITFWTSIVCFIMTLLLHPALFPFAPRSAASVEGIICSTDSETLEDIFWSKINLTWGTQVV